MMPRMPNICAGSGRAVFQEAERLVGEVEVGQGGQGRQVAADLQQGERGPAQQHDHHDGGDLHDPESFFAGLVDALDVLPPVVKRDRQGKHDRGGVDVDLRRAVKEVMHGARESSRERRR